MNLTCARCGNFKRTQEGHFCRECDLKNREDVRRIQDFILANKGASLADVAIETGISMKVINVLIKERLIALAEIDNDK